MSLENIVKLRTIIKHMGHAKQCPRGMLNIPKKKIKINLILGKQLFTFPKC
jgi:hypothetical protein